MEEYSSTTYNSDGEYEEGSSGYTLEPEHTKEELEKLGIKTFESDDDIVSSDDSTGDLDSSRLGNLHWCTCGHCRIMPSLVESKRECANLLEDKLDNMSNASVNTRQNCFKHRIYSVSEIQK